MKNLEIQRHLNRDAYRVPISFIDRDGKQVVYQRVLNLNSWKWTWLTFYGEPYGDDYPQSHESLKAMRTYMAEHADSPECLSCN